MIVARNGDWVAACRTDNPKRFAHHAFDHYSGLAVSISKDEGKTWSELNTLHEWGRHHPSMVLLPDGSILMSYVVRLGYPHDAQGFPQFGVEAVVSRDNGRTWDLPRRYILAQWTGNLKGEDDWYGGVQSSLHGPPARRNAADRLRHRFSQRPGHGAVRDGRRAGPMANGIAGEVEAADASPKPGRR